MIAPSRPRQSARRAGFAIVIVLAAIVLLVGVALAFFSNSLLQKQISQSSASRLKTDIFAQGAVDTVVSDLKAEIKAGSSISNIVTGTATTTLYFPVNATNVVPSLVGSTGTNGLENLLKRSSGSVPFFTGFTNRAAAYSSTNDAGGARAISLARWNKALLLPATSATNLAPTNTAGFVAPDWIFVSRDGSNPTAWSDPLKTSKTNAATVVGRYAYTIYDEGGLLDVNAAGYPSTISANNKVRKATLAHADLAALFEYVGFSSARATQIVDALVTWRNEATLQGGDTGFNSWAVFNSKGFLSTASTNLISSKSDRIFTSRQQLQKFLLENVATSAEQAQMQKALNYLATFTRDLNQPAYVKTQSADSTSPGYSANAPKIQTVANGGNNQASLDIYVNPPFPLVRVKTSFVRNDGSTANVGEPLVKQRFALSRLAWLTYKGPSANRSQSDTDIQTLINTYGITWGYLQQGTAENIKKYFGLSWVPDSGSSLGKWVYDVHNGSSGTGSTGPIMRLGAPGDTGGLANLSTPREPDFFELLKATINAGSKAKAVSINQGTTGPADYQAQRDNSFDYAILQIGANIIAQSRVDGFGIRIGFNDGTLAAKEFQGVINCPYLYRVRWGVLKIRNENPVITGDLPVPNAAANAVVAPSGASYATSQGVLIDPGVSMMMLIPEIWNPHDQNCPLPALALRPTKFRLVTDSTDPDSIASSGGAGYGQATAKGRDSKSPGNPYSIPKALAGGSSGVPYFSRAKGGAVPEITGGYSGNLHAVDAASSALAFDVPNSSFFREPTLLARANVPVGSNLKVDSSNWNTGAAPAIDYANIETTNGKSFTGLGFAADINNPLTLPSGVVSGTYVGIPVGLFPVEWVRARSSSSEPQDMISRSDLCEPSGSKNFTIRIQYQDPTNSNNWITYDTKYVSPSSAWLHNILGASGTGGMMQWTAVWASFTDPRTGRFGGITPSASDSGGASLGSTQVSAMRGPGAAAFVNPSPNYGVSEGSSANPSEWLDQSSDVLISNRPTFDGGLYFAVSGAKAVSNQAPGWQSDAMLLGMLSQNSLAVVNDGQKYSGVFGTGVNAGAANSHYYLDADNVLRRAMGGYATGSTTVGLPMASTLTPGGATMSGQSKSRPWVLNRPYRNVGELGYAFSDTPWKNLDFFTPESGDSALLDVFCVNEVSTSSGLVAGKVNLNTKQVPVLKAIIANAYTDEQTPSSSPIDRSVGGVADQVATALVQRTLSTSGTGGKLGNPGELVSKWIGSSNTAPIDGSTAYDGFSKDLTTVFQTAYGANSSMGNIQRFREAVIRPLASVGTTRVWNVMIDLVAQTGRFPQSAGDFSKFTVEGEQRYWVHLSIDRLTGQVLDRQIEVVTE